MPDFFNNPEDLLSWVKSRNSPNDASTTIMGLIQENDTTEAYGNDEQEINETCNSIYYDNDENAAKILFGVLAKHNITTLRKAGNMNKEAQAVESRQRNNWVRGQRNKWNRVVDGFNEGTPWRTERDKMYNFTHYYTDAVQFDENPNHVYSGEAIWRMYVMDKFYRDYQDKDGAVVGGYINDRFHRFPTAGTPDNPDVPRSGGNPLALANGEKTRKPRPHQYSTERRLEEARGNETYDLEATASSKSYVKISSKLDVKERQNDIVYNMFKDVMNMREAGIEYSTILSAVADHYKTSIMNVAQIDNFAKKIKEKHSNIIYTFQKTAQSVLLDPSITGRNLRIDHDNVTGKGANGEDIPLPRGTVITKLPGEQNLFEIVDGDNIGSKIVFEDPNVNVSMSSPIQNAATELGLNEDSINMLGNAENAADSSLAEVSKQDATEDFSVTEI